MKERVIALIDMKAFYASIECVKRGLDPFSTPLVVTDTSRKESTIVLSVSPYLKDKEGVPSRCRRKDLPKSLENHIIFATPRMELYVKESAKIVSIFLDFVGLDDIHIYSIDECFLDLTPYLTLYKCSPVELAKRILDKIKLETGLTATCGLGSNMFLAKVADDIYAKKSKDFIATLFKDEIESKLWTISPLNKVWGISDGYLKRLNRLGIYSVYDLANFNKNDLIKAFGVLGEELYNHANGIDETNIREKYIPINKAISNGQVLMKDYSFKGALLVLKEMNDDLCFRLRALNKKTSIIHLSVGYSLKTIEDFGFSHELSLSFPTNNNEEIYEGIKYLFNKYAKDYPIRRLNITFSNLTNNSYKQLSLFRDEEKEMKEEKYYDYIDEIQEKYGMNKLLKLDSKKEDSTAKIRHNQIGGHRK